MDFTYCNDKFPLDEIAKRKKIYALLINDIWNKG
jgi:hypothetical protein